MVCRLRRLGCRRLCLGLLVIVRVRCRRRSLRGVGRLGGPVYGRGRFVRGLVRVWGRRVCCSVVSWIGLGGVAMWVGGGVVWLRMWCLLRLFLSCLMLVGCRIFRICCRICFVLVCGFDLVGCGTEVFRVSRHYSGRCPT